MGVLGLLSGSWVVVLESQLRLGGRDTLGLLIGPRVLLRLCRESSTDQSTGSCTEGANWPAGDSIRV